MGKELLRPRRSTVVDNLTNNQPLAADADLVTNPFLHREADRVYSPLTDRSMVSGDGDYETLCAILDGAVPSSVVSPEVRDRLVAGLWLVPSGQDLSRQFQLKYVSLETHTVCNQGCYFCPVSVDRRAPYFMPTELFDRLIGELAAYRDTIEAVSTINYNEPTVDRRFVDQIRAIKAAGMPPAVVTNGWGLTREVLDELAEMGGVRHLIVNLSTLDRERYRVDRGADHVVRVLGNLEYARTMPLAEDMKIVVLGRGDDVHRGDFAAIADRFAGSHFVTEYHVVMDRAGHLDVGLRPEAPHQRLCGCENVGSRPLQHIHITPHGSCVLCCEDYDERYLVGDLTRQSLEEVLTGDVMAMMRRWTYGLEEAPDDFICRKCVFALTRTSRSE